MAISTRHTLIICKHQRPDSLPLFTQPTTPANIRFDPAIHTNIYGLYLKRPHLLQTIMPEYPRPPAMSPSDWRLWCCCHPEVTPPSSSPRAHNNYSLDEFDPRNRMSMSKAIKPPPRTPPSSPVERSISATAPSSRIKFSEPPRSTPHRNRTPVARDRAPQRPPTVLLPSPPHLGYQRLPLRPKETSKSKGKQSMPKLIRHDTEPGQHWWQVGRRLMDRNNNGSDSQDDGSVRDEPKKVRRSGR